MMMLGSSIPSCDSKIKSEKKTGAEEEEVINADDPHNRDKVRNMLFGK